MALIMLAMVAFALGGAIVALTIVVLATSRPKRPSASDPAAAYAGDHRTVT